MRPGDKVLVRDGDHAGQRGILLATGPDSVLIDIDGHHFQLPPVGLRNFSLAARKAWETMPSRKAGRPKNPDLPLKRVVTLRVEDELWRRLGAAAEAGLVRSREAAVNQWIKERLDELDQRL